MFHAERFTFDSIRAAEPRSVTRRDLACVPLAMASDFNPGSSPSGNMQLILSMASIQYRLTPEEGLNATTINGAYAMDVSEQTGSITVGKRADFYITRPIPGIAYMPYYYGVNKIYKAFIRL